jgi:hypothetical protein
MSYIQMSFILKMQVAGSCKTLVPYTKVHYDTSEKIPFDAHCRED